VVHEKKMFIFYAYFAPYWAPKGFSTFILTNLNSQPTTKFSTKFEFDSVVLEKKSFKRIIFKVRYINVVQVGIDIFFFLFLSVHQYRSFTLIVYFI